MKLSLLFSESYSIHKLRTDKRFFFNEALGELYAALGNWKYNFKKRFKVNGYLQIILRKSRK